MQASSSNFYLSYFRLPSPYFIWSQSNVCVASKKKLITFFNFFTPKNYLEILNPDS